MTHLNLIDLYSLRKRYIKESYNQILIDEINSIIIKKESLLFEDGGGTSATGGIGGGAGAVSTAMMTPGMGPISNSQPSMFPGANVDPAYSAGGGHPGSGDIGFPLNMGPKGVYQKIPAGGSEHGGKAAKRNRREKKIDMKQLRSMLTKKPDSQGPSSSPSSRVMNFDNFAKSQFTKITKLRQ